MIVLITWSVDFLRTISAILFEYAYGDYSRLGGDIILCKRIKAFEFPGKIRGLF